MTRRFLLFLLCAFSLPLYAQKENGEQTRRGGVGVTFGTEHVFYSDYRDNSYPKSFGNIYFPINITHKFRIEPEIGLFYRKYKYENSRIDYISQDLRFGLGLFVVQSYKSTKIYWGPRVGVIHTSRNTDQSMDRYSSHIRKTDKYIGLSVGAEYLFSSHFSLGGEAQINYFSLGQFEDTAIETEYFVSNRALVVVRFYF